MAIHEGAQQGRLEWQQKRHSNLELLKNFPIIPSRSTMWENYQETKLVLMGLKLSKLSLCSRESF